MKKIIVLTVTLVSLFLSTPASADDTVYSGGYPFGFVENQTCWGPALTTFIRPSYPIYDFRSGTAQYVGFVRFTDASKKKVQIHLPGETREVSYNSEITFSKLGYTIALKDKRITMTVQ